ncbi:MAG: amidohydrolase family protein [Acidimicrobiia bacterium]
MLDLVVRGGTVVDGSGAPPITADVGVRDGRVVEVGEVDEDAREVVDADGCVVAPGFIDIHTHYDAQLHWEPTASPSSWHGVTSVICGNCGFSLFPAKPDDVPWLLKMLSRVEGMSPETLAAGVTFGGGGLSEFAAGLTGRIGVNAGFQVGHSAVRRHVMGEEAGTRAATDEEIGAMGDLVRGALADGAVGFTSSQLEIHSDHEGQPVPSNLATRDELIALATVVGESPHGVIEFIPWSNLEGYTDEDRELMLAMCDASRTVMNVNPVQHLPTMPDTWKRVLEFVDGAHRKGARIYPQSATQQLQVFFALHDTFLFDQMASFREILTLPPVERAAKLNDPAHREVMRAELADPTGRAFVFKWDNVKVARADDHSDWVGKTVPELRSLLSSGDDLDAFLDASLAEDLRTTFTLGGSPGRRNHEATAEIVAHPFTLPGSSDAGAHLTSYCGVDYTTRLFTEFVPGSLPIEQAVARLTGIPAAMYGLTDRGMLRPGAFADVVVWDPARLSSGATRWSQDFPAGGGRFVVDSQGYVALIVNGQIVRRDNEDTGARPGQVLRPG